ncbi:MAG: hypothetical protein LBT54_02200, partial [Bifidobacteriaceae bacterium]|nr:hypothetical protein [Bifidobacteriaceae bacterium]
MDPQNDAVSPLAAGDSLMGRYRLTSELTSTHPWAFRWLAQDRILRREVEVHLLIGPHVEDAIDAARRAALVPDARLARIIDAGHYGQSSFILTAPLTGVSLAQAAPLAADDARALAGEVASALRSALAASLHHLTLRPELVYLTGGHGVAVGGAGWDAALWGVANPDAAGAELRDTTDVVALLYCALTGRWPGPTPSFAPPAPSDSEGPARASTLTQGVPGDLDALAALTLGPRASGPRTLAELVDD